MQIYKGNDNNSKYKNAETLQPFVIEKKDKTQKIKLLLFCSGL